MASDEAEVDEAKVLCCSDVPPESLERLFTPYAIPVSWVPRGEPIPGSHWGAPEAGMLRGTLFVRPDTPVHSALHEGAHLICMGAPRRATVDSDAGGEEIEECAVCYLQVLLADRLPGVGRDRLMQDMDSWGYSFRLGSTRAWFEQDAEEVVPWLESQGLLRGGELPALAASERGGGTTRAGSA